MKKINIFELLSIGLLILIGCFLMSFVSKKMFDMDADFLSAAATFFTGVVAFKLFNDWRTQYRTELLERLKDRFSNLLIKIEEVHDSLNLYVSQMVDSFDDFDVLREVTTRIDHFCTLIENLEDELDFYEKIYIEFSLNLYPEIVPPTEMIKGLVEITDELAKINKTTDENVEYLNQIRKYFNSRKAAEKIISYKINLCHDLHEIIIDLITDNKGH